MKHFLFTIFMFLAFECHSQNYDLAIGARVGTNSGLSIRKNIADYWAGELVLGSYNDATALTFLIERQMIVNWIDDFPLTLYYGFGVHLGVGSYVPKYVFEHSNPYYGTKRTSLRTGIDAVFGVEYRIPQYPFALSLESKPYFEFFGGGYSGLYMPAIAVSVKYILK